MRELLNGEENLYAEEDRLQEHAAPPGPEPKPKPKPKFLQELRQLLNETSHQRDELATRFDQSQEELMQVCATLRSVS